jgi:hypothetical protein
MDGEEDADGSTDAALLASTHDPVVAPVVHRVQQKRLAFLEACFRDMGLPRGEARHRARIGYSIYLGWLRQLQAGGRADAWARERAAYQRVAIDLVTRPR